MNHNDLDLIQGGQESPTEEYYHTTAAEHTALRTHQPFGAGRVLFADGDGYIQHDGGFTYDAPSDTASLGKLLLTAGTASACALARQGYTGDGLFFPAGNAVGLATNTVERARIDNSGLSLLGAAGGPGSHAIFAGDRPAHIWLDQTLAGGGYAQDLYHSVHSGGKAFRWGRSQGVYDRESFLEYMRLYHGGGDTDTYLAVPIGSAATPGLAFIANPQCGLYYGATFIGTVLGAAERWRWSGNNVGMVSGGQLFLDGVTCDGTTYLKARAANTLSAYAGGALSWEFTSAAIVPGADNARDIGTSSVGARALYLSDANASAPATDGEVRVRSTDNALEHRIGSVVHRNGLCIYSGSVETDDTWSASERTLDSFTIPAAYWKVGKRIQVRATVLVVLGTGEQGGGSVTLKVRIGTGGTAAMEKTMSLTPPPGWKGGHFDFEMDFVVGAVAASGDTLYPTRTIRSFTSENGALFGDLREVGKHEMYPMKAVGDPGPALAIDTTAAQAISVKYVCSGNGTVTVMLYGLTIYSR